MKIKNIAKRIKRIGDPKLSQLAMMIEHLNHRGFFGPYLDTIERAKFEKIMGMLERIADLDPEPGPEMARLIKAGFIGFSFGRNGTYRPRPKKKDS